MNTSPPPESSSRSAAAPTRTTPGTIVIGSTCWAVMTPMIADPQTPRPSCVYYCTLRTLAPAIHHTKVPVKALDARLGALPCQESWSQAGDDRDLLPVPLGVGAAPLGGVQLEPVDQFVAAGVVHRPAEATQQVDRLATGQVGPQLDVTGHVGQATVQRDGVAPRVPCLLYTSDAADEE